MLHGNDGLLDGVHAANTGAIWVAVLVGVPGAHTLDPCDFIGFFPVIRTHQVAHVRPGRGEYPLKLHTGDHIRRFGVAVCIQITRVVYLVAYGYDDCTDLQFRLLRFIIITYGFG
jgi:hypothetical protein